MQLTVIHQNYPEMATRTIKNLQQNAENCYCVRGHFRILGTK